MMELKYSQKREWKSYGQRSVVMGKRAMVASSQPLASLSGLEVLKRGGNAVDAAVAMMSTLSVVEPYSVGIGGDAFALIYLAEQKRLVGINGSGHSPLEADADALRRRRFKTMPERGIFSVTVPGALQAWEEAVKRYGSMDFSELLLDAISYATEGFPVTEVIAGEWKEAAGVLRGQESAKQTYLPNGQAPRPGEIFRNESLARTYRKIALEGAESLYHGELCDAVARFAEREGGWLRREDLEAHETTWVEPLAVEYRGYTIYELPPNTQGITALEMLNILKGYEVSSLQHNGSEHLHLFIEAKKTAFEDRDHLLADREFADVPVFALLSEEHATQCRQRIDPARAGAVVSSPLSPQASDTVYVSTMDEKGNAVSFISSLFKAFGSGLVVPGTGILLQNRGSSFSLDPAHPNRLDPKKRPMHTLIPGMVFKEGHFFMSFGVMGGDMQPQGHVQFLMNLMDFKMNPQDAVDAPRARHLSGKDVYLEEGIPERTVSMLRQKGHCAVNASSPVNQVGGGQAIVLDPSTGVLLGASDRRKDGCAMGY